MNTTGHHRLSTPVMLAIAGAMLIWVSQSTIAQDKKAAGKDTKTSVKSTKAKAHRSSKPPTPTGVNVAPVGKDAKAAQVAQDTQAPKDKGFVGPLKPGEGRQGMSVNRPAKSGGKRPSNIPKPTVVLKPGEVPAIKFDTPVYDFGSMRAGPDVEHDFWFTNTGTGPLEILKVRPG